jgi:ubiquinone/menaquinone biosynthesis C-methylase UbiE
MFTRIYFKNTLFHLDKLAQTSKIKYLVFNSNFNNKKDHMKKLNELTKEDVLGFDYNNLISIVKETNRPPGGERSISAISQKAFLNANSRILEIGTSTGVTAIELAKLVGCKIDAIDINPRSIEEAKNRAKMDGVDSLINFEVQDATNTNFEDNTFDLVFCGNVTSLISNKEKALDEYYRVLKPGKFIAAIPMYYIETPSEKLIKDISDAIQVNIEPLYKDFWFDFFKRPNLNLYHHEDYSFDFISSKKVVAFNKKILSREHLNDLSPDAKSVLNKKYSEYMFLFRENLAHMGFSVTLFRKVLDEIDEELFTSTFIESD